MVIDRTSREAQRQALIENLRTEVYDFEQRIGRRHAEIFLMGLMLQALGFAKLAYGINAKEEEAVPLPLPADGKHPDQKHSQQYTEAQAFFESNIKKPVEDFCKGSLAQNVEAGLILGTLFGSLLSSHMTLFYNQVVWENHLKNHHQR